MADGVSGKPLWIVSTRADMSGSLPVAVRTSSHVTDLMSSVAVDAQVCEQRGGAGSLRDRSAARAAAATSLGRSGVLATPTGCRDRASATVLRTPGMWSTRNRYRSDFSLMFHKRGFGMSSRARSPSTLISGLWSTATMRFEHPRVKCQALSRVSTTASASPSMGA